ncbi:hypothetical protein LJB42_003347 [Komagataella kurtzmanii]|nr:hypothetical protein LJB42_003347 [Komagataella kurtzmanii]
MTTNDQSTQPLQITSITRIPDNSGKFFEITLDPSLRLYVSEPLSFKVSSFSKLVKLHGSSGENLDEQIRAVIETGPFETVDTENELLRGKWIGKDRCLELSKSFRVDDIIDPLLNKIETELSKDIPQVATASNQSDQPSFYTAVFNGGTDNTSSNINNNNTNSPVMTRAFSTLTENDNVHDVSMDLADQSLTTPVKRAKTNIDPSSLPEGAQFTFDINAPNPDAPYALKPISETNNPRGYDLQKSKSVIMSIFLSKDTEVSLIDIVGNDPHYLDELCIDVPFDDLGQTALHWAATLGRTYLIRELVKHKANRLRGNVEGETALVHSILVTNSFDAGNFSEILDLLYPAITIFDYQGRTILHHIALTSGIKGRSSASKYYLSTLLEWIVRKGALLPGQQNLPLGKFMSQVLNVQDKNGDTCLNIAARIGNKTVVQQLLDLGANPNVPNKAGLRPLDFGININGISLAKESSLPQASFSSAPSFSAPKQNSSKIVNDLQTMLSALSTSFNQELNSKTKNIESLQETLRSSTQRLSKARSQLYHLQDTEATFLELKSKLANIEKSINDEENSFKINAQELPNLTSFVGDFDADEPFTVLPVYNAIEAKIASLPEDKREEVLANLKDNIDKEEIYQVLVAKNFNLQELPPSVVLNARIEAYQENEAKLVEILENLKSKSSILQSKFKRVVALCTSVDEKKVDELLDSLVQAVESEPEDMDINKVTGFLKKVDNTSY